MTAEEGSPIDVALSTGVALSTEGPGAEAALLVLRQGIDGLEGELRDLEREMAELQDSEAAIDAEAANDGGSARMAHEFAEAALDLERADMRRFLDGTEAVSAARVAEARSEAQAALQAAREELTRAMQERSVIVERVIDSPPDPVVAPDTIEEAVEDAADAPGGAEVAPAARPGPAPGRAQRTLTVAMWLVGGVLAVLTLAFLAVVVLMLLD